MGSLRIKWTKSAIGYRQRQKDTIQALGLRRLNHTVELPDNPAIRGMVNRVRHLVMVEEMPEAVETAPEQVQPAAPETQPSEVPEIVAAPKRVVRKRAKPLNPEVAE